MAEYRARKWRRRLTSSIGLLVGAAVIGGLTGFGSTRDFSNAKVEAPDEVSSCRAVDGDTLNCGGERIRLLGIDAPEMGECRPGRVCVPGDPVAATRSLFGLIKGPLKIERVGEDHYGRTLALVSSGAGDFSCLQIQRGHAIYKARWDEGRRVAQACPDIVRD